MGLFNVAITGMAAYQSALDTTFNNVTNANTPDYSRRNVNFESNEGMSGVTISDLSRSHDEFVNVELRNNISFYNETSTSYDLSSYLDSYLGNDDYNVGNELQSYFSELQNLSADPASLTSRQMFLNQSDSLVSVFHDVSFQLDHQTTDIDKQLRAAINDVNTLTQGLADLNGKIAMNTGDLANLLDQRDKMLKELSSYMSISTAPQSNGTINVYATGGSNLVLGAISNDLEVGAGDFQPDNSEIKLKSQGLNSSISMNVEGGTIGGLISYRDDILEPAKINLDRLSLLVAGNVNDQHQKGLNLNNELGGLFFSDINSAQSMANRVLPSGTNNGTGTFTVNIDDVNELALSDYLLVFTSPTDYRLTRLSDDEVITAGSITGFPEDISVDGFTLSITGGSYSSSDQFLVSPTSNASRTLDLEITDARQLALASPLRLDASLSNTGQGKISFVDVTDITNPTFATPGQLSPPIRIEFLSDTSYQILNDNTSAVIEGPIAYDSSSANPVFPTPGSYDSGYRIDISGRAKAGDTFTLTYNSDAGSDNSNSKKLLDLQKINLAGGYSSTLEDAYYSMANSVASSTHSVNMRMQSADILMQQSQSQRDSLAGVNLDEEAANLVRYQDAYRACAQLISVANSLFDTLLQML